MVGVYTGAAELYHFAAKWFVRRKIKFPFAVVSEIRRRELPSLQSIGADNLARGGFFDDEMIAELIEWIDIEPSRVRLGQSFAQFEVENLKPQLLGAPHFVCASRQSRHVPWTRRCCRHEGSVSFEQCVQSCSPGALRRARSTQFDDLRRSRDRFRRGNIHKTVRDRASVGRSRTSLSRHGMDGLRSR